MADTASEIFTKKATDKLHSPDDLDSYVRVTTPRVWLALAACAALLVGLFAWGIFGTAATSVSSTGTCIDDKTVCFLSADEITKVRVGDIATVGKEQMTVSSLSDVPVSRIEARDIVGSDYLATSLVEDDWTYVVYLEGDGDQDIPEGVPLSVRITTERIAPISLIFGSAT